MENFATRFADLLESTAIKARSIGLLALIFLFMTIHEALAIPLGSAAAHAIIAGLFAVGAAFLWSKRDPQDEA